MKKKGKLEKGLEIHIPSFSRIGSYSDCHFCNYEEQAKLIDSLTSKNHKNKKIKFSISVSLKKDKSFDKFKYLEEDKEKQRENELTELLGNSKLIQLLNKPNIEKIKPNDQFQADLFMKINKKFFKTPFNIHYNNNIKRAVRHPLNKLSEDTPNKKSHLSKNKDLFNSIRKNLSIQNESSSPSFKSISREKWLDYNLFKEKLGLPNLNRYRPKFTKIEKKIHSTIIPCPNNIIITDICKSINEFQGIKISNIEPKDSNQPKKKEIYENTKISSQLENNTIALKKGQDSINISTPQLNEKIKRLLLGNKILEKKFKYDKWMKSMNSPFQYKPISISNHIFSLDLSKYSKRKSILNNLNDNRFNINLNDSMNKIKNRRFIGHVLMKKMIPRIQSQYRDFNLLEKYRRFSGSYQSID